MKSLMFIPAKEKFLAKIPSFNADKYIIDLEDSIPENDKESALETVYNWLCNTTFDKKRLFIRLNKNRYYKEALKLEEFIDLGFMLPKFESFSDYNDIEKMLINRYVIALVESPRGIAELKEIVRTDWVNALAFGAEDFTSSLNMVNSDQYLVGIKSLIVTYAKAYNKLVFDTPSFAINNEDIFVQDVQHSIDLGFDGKLIISPKHIDYINSKFNDCDFNKYKEIIEAFESTADAVVVINGKVYEKMHIDRMKRILKENDII